MTNSQTDPNPTGPSATQSPYSPEGPYANAGTYHAPQPLWEHDARTISALTHVSAFFFPFLGPFVAYLVFRGRSLLVEHHAKEQMNLAISLVIYLVVAVVATVFTLGLALLVVVPALVVVPIAAFILTIVAAVSASRGEYYRFPFILRFIH